MLDYLLKLLQGEDAFTVDVRMVDGGQLNGAAVRSAHPDGLVLSWATNPEADTTNHHDVLVPWSGVARLEVVY